MLLSCWAVPKYNKSTSKATSLFYMGENFIPFMNLSLQSSIKCEKNMWMEDWEGQKKTRRFFLFFYCSKSSLFLKVSSVWNAPPLNYFTFFCSRLTYPQAHTVWLAVFSPTLAPPRVLWLALLFPCPRYDIPPFLSPPLSSLYSRLGAPASVLSESPSVPVKLECGTFFRPNLTHHRLTETSR